ncbi:MAG: hypothetical protein HYX27_04360 [Acidobacteria bacterium]|nr:hypothetical protein [Acidobacteriota bacterium]
MSMVIWEAIAQPQSADPRADVLRKRRQTYPELCRVVDLAQYVPPEFAADALLRVAGAPRNRDREWRIELLEQSFEMSVQVPELNRQRILGKRIVARSRTEIRSLGFDQRLDRLSLQSRAVREMMSLDRQKALQMFQRIAWPRLHKLECRDALIDHVDEYYSLLAEMVDSAFTPEQRARGQHIDLLSRQMSRMISAVEVGAMAKAVSSSTLADEELAFLSSRLVAALDQIQTDDRSFSASLSGADLEFHHLVRIMGTRGISAGGLISAYRRYLVRNLAGNRCADTGGSELSSEVLDSFNQNLASASDSNRAPLTPDDLKPSKTQGHADWEIFVDDAEFNRAWQDFLDLLLGKGRGSPLGAKPLSDEQKNTLEWRTQFDDFLRQIDEARPNAGDSEHRLFYRKATALHGALRVARAGPDRERVIRQYVALLQSSNLQRESLLEWYGQVQRSVNSIRGLGPEASEVFLDELERSGSAVLCLYAVVSRVIPEAK